MAVRNRISSATFFTLGAITMLLGLPLQIAAAPSSQPTSVPSTAPTDSPSGTMHAYLQALDSGDRKRSLACWNTVDPQEDKVAGLQVDMMLAVSKLKKAVRAKWGDVASFDLEMAVAGEDECGLIKEQTHGDTSSIQVASVDERQPHRDYLMVRVLGHWKLSVADELKNRVANRPLDDDVAAGRIIMEAINSAADDVANGKLQSTNDVKRKISEAWGAP